MIFMLDTVFGTHIFRLLVLAFFLATHFILFLSGGFINLRRRSRTHVPNVWDGWAFLTFGNEGLRLS